ncbi:MAG TPA: zf-HC2 domain-containing protein [Bacteroidales bacterium]|nr:zf-HC2 domain-containing protein [Bacteroidales bacterium]
MKCNCLNSDLILYAEGSLPPERSDDLEFHIAECSECMEFLQFLKKLMTVVEKDKEIGQNAFLYTRIMAKMGADEKQTRFELKRLIPAFAFSTILMAGIFGGINLGKLYSGSISGYSNDLQEEISYIDDIKQESIEAFFLTSNDEEDE